MKKVTKTLTGAVSAAGAMLVSAMPVAAQANVQKPWWAKMDTSLGGIINIALNLVFGIGIIIALFYLVWGAFNWITSGGEKSKTADARNRIIAAVVGLILLAATWAILSIVLRVLGLGTVEQAIDQSMTVTPQ